MLGNSEYAKTQPWDYQISENLVYCNLFEHFLLHAKIVEENKFIPSSGELVGIGGIINYIVPEIAYNSQKNNSCFENIKYLDFYKFWENWCKKVYKNTIYNKIPQYSSRDILKISKEQAALFTMRI